MRPLALNPPRFNPLRGAVGQPPSGFESQFLLEYPGEEAQVDYGEGAPIRQLSGGRHRKPRLFAMTTVLLAALVAH
jgi:hypothetical protein